MENGLGTSIPMWKTWEIFLYVFYIGSALGLYGKKAESFLCLYWLLVKIGKTLKMLICFL